MQMTVNGSCSNQPYWIIDITTPTNTKNIGIVMALIGLKHRAYFPQT